MVFLILVSSLSILIGTKRASAQTPSGGVCRVVLSLDRSRSIGTTNLNAMKNQILLLFDQFVGTNVEFAFWTFSHDPNPTPGYNYNIYSHGYERPGDAAAQSRFEAALNSFNTLGGQTNYEQALSYNNGTPNNTPRIKDIRDNADVISIITDGVPNYPGNQDPVDSSPFPNLAETSAHNAVLKIKEDDEGVRIIGNTIGVSQRSMNYVVNGNKNDSTNVGPLEFSSIEEYLSDRIDDACNVQSVDYSLKPIVQANQSVISAGETPSFDYQVDNNTSDGTSGASNWSIFDVIIKPGVFGNPLTCGATGYCNSIPDCTAIYTLLGGRDKGECRAAIDVNNTGNTGRNTFAPSLTNLYQNRPAVVDNIENLALGSRVCRVLQIATATGTGGGSNRISGACIPVAKAPLVQIHGGDLRVGRHFANPNDNSPFDPTAGVFTSAFTIGRGSAIAPFGRTYGSWVEYGVLAPGPIKKIASLSGYSDANGMNGGYDGNVAGSGCVPDINKLTFSNTDADESGSSTAHAPECGHFAESLGNIPDVISTLTDKTPLNSAWYNAQPVAFNENTAEGLYKNDTEGAKVRIGRSTIANPSATRNDPNVPGKVFVVYVPRGTVVIEDNITQAGDTYQKIKQIPQLIIIARDIKILPNVEQVDAWLVAPGVNNNEGRINTCVDPVSGNTPALSANVCDKTLRINGPILARQLLLWRTKVDKSNPACQVVAANSCQDVGIPGEVINLPGTSLLWAAAYGANLSSAQTTYTTELPPFY